MTLSVLTLQAVALAAKADAATFAAEFPGSTDLGDWTSEASSKSLGELKRKLGLELSQRDEETLVKHYNNVLRSEVEALASKGKVVDLFAELAALGQPTEEDREREARIAKAMGVPGDLVFLRYVDPDTGVSELIQQLGRADSAEQVLELGVDLEYEDILGVSREKGNWRLDVRAPEWQLDLWRESEGGTY